MYTPAQFKVEDAGEAHALMRAHPFAVLVTHGSEGLTATHLPTVLKVDSASPLGRIECHVARPNPQWKTFASEADALMIFQGPEAYIRPGWYPSKAEHGKAVPTWNYAAVHAYGLLRVMNDKAWLLAHVGELSDQQEAPYTGALVDGGCAGELSRRDGAGHRRLDARDHASRRQGEDEPEPRPCAIAPASSQGLRRARRRSTMRKRRRWSTS